MQTPASSPTLLPFASSRSSAKIRSSPRLVPVSPMSTCVSWNATSNVIVRDAVTLVLERDAAATPSRTMARAAATAIIRDLILMVASLGMAPHKRRTYWSYSLYDLIAKVKDEPAQVSAG